MCLFFKIPLFILTFFETKQTNRVIRVFAIEKHATTQDDLENARILAEVIKAGGANYGTGVERS